MSPGQARAYSRRRVADTWRTVFGMPDDDGWPRSFHGRSWTEAWHKRDRYEAR